MSHDQRFKEFLREFFQEFLELFYPDVEARLRFHDIEFPETELFIDFPTANAVRPMSLPSSRRLTEARSSF